MRKGPSLRTVIFVGICPPENPVVFFRCEIQVALPRASVVRDATARRVSGESVLGHARIYFVRPGQDAALQIQQLLESCGLQEMNGVGGALSAAAVNDHFH